MKQASSIAKQLFRRNFLILFAFTALLACVLLKPVVMSRPVYSFQVTFDISQSMNVIDVVSDNTVISRLAAAREAAFKLLQRLPCGSEIGWSVFTGRRVVSLIAPVEVCEHYDGLLSSLEFIDHRMRWANASGIGKGLHQSIRAADTQTGAPRIIFFTDGQEAPPQSSGHRGMPSTDKYKVNGLIVGVGGSTPARIPKAIDEDGRVMAYWQADEVVQRVDAAPGQSHEELSSRQDAHLGKLGRLAKLSYLPLHSSGQLAEAAIDKSFAHVEDIPVDLRWIPASIALLLLSLRFLPDITAFYPRHRRSAGVL
ncbi:hypothetical protein AB833_20805 [Chromatiales bacterium (ex Bugula neritina AB1)]|nr:hypothetical protein AB833_20805 [Chromatiales bacterium (ex Bugula neritina AB1)]